MLAINPMGKVPSLILDNGEVLFDSRAIIDFLDGEGEVGFISSVSAPFCGDCHRARLSADGTVYTCLFSSNGTSLREVLRSGASDADIVGLLQNTWRHRADRYSELRGRATKKKDISKVEMYRMGG